jgi:hypothetical protein
MKGNSAEATVVLVLSLPFTLLPIHKPLVSQTAYVSLQRAK